MIILNQILQHERWVETGGRQGRRLRLEGKDLSGVVLRCVRLDRCVLRDCDLSGAILRGSNLAGADLSGSEADHADIRGCVTDEKTELPESEKMHTGPWDVPSPRQAHDFDLEVAHHG